MRRQHPWRLILASALALALLGNSKAQAALTLLSSFSAGVGELVGVAYDQTNNLIWAYGNFDPDLRSYSSSGVFQTSIPRPGEAADDFDLDIAPEALSLAGVALPAGTLLATNGETGTAEIYAVDKSTGAVLATLNTPFGIDHVVGGSYHPTRDTFFLLQDRQPGALANRNLVAEINPATGAVINTFKIDSVLADYTINYGDLEVSTVSGNLIFVSSDETSFAEFTPDGAFVQLIDRPAGPSSLSGIGLNDGAGEIWVSGTGGTIWQLGGLPVPEPATLQLALFAAISAFLVRRPGHPRVRLSN